jgi:hypothetical protein
MLKLAANTSRSVSIDLQYFMKLRLHKWIELKARFSVVTDDNWRKQQDLQHREAILASSVANWRTRLVPLDVAFDPIMSLSRNIYNYERHGNLYGLWATGCDKFAGLFRMIFKM